MDDDEAIRRITKLLEQGCTMLAAHHDCGAPLFRCKGEVVCPVCSFEKAEATSTAGSELARPREAVGEARFEGTKLGNGLMHGEETKPRDPVQRSPVQREARGNLAEGLEGRGASATRINEETPEALRPRDDQRAAEAHLGDSLLRRLRALTVEMEEEQDLDRLRKQLECIEGLVRVLKALGG
jgi:UPF0148 protein